MLAKIELAIVGTSTATVRLRAEARPGDEVGHVAQGTGCRFDPRARLGATSAGTRNARLAVITDTPAQRATSSSRTVAEGFGSRRSMTERSKT